MFDDTKGLYIQRLSDGQVRIVKRVDNTPGSDIVFDVTLSPEQWCRAVASVAQECESCRAYFMAYAGHMGEQAPTAEPLNLSKLKKTEG